MESGTLGVDVEAHHGLWVLIRGGAGDSGTEQELLSVFDKRFIFRT